MEICYDICFSNEGTVFDQKCFRVLQKVEETGSLNKAAKELQLPYCSVFKIVKKSEEKFGFTLLERKTGGSGGGGSQLTPQAREFMARYKSFNNELLEGIRHIQEKHFG
jgi:molybdate transport system regulatory protein